MRVIADFHLHSKYSRATSPEMEIGQIARWAALKGLDLVGTGDFTHPLYLAGLKAHLEPAEPGLFRLKGSPAPGTTVRFLLTTEVSNVFRQGGRLRRIHTLLFAPSLQAVEKINAVLARYGNLASDGRPTFTFPARDLIAIALDASPDCLVVPAHAWTPWFSLFGSHAGFDSIADCYGEHADQIRAIETGLSSDPEMNWRLSALDGVALISNSDAHSPSRLGREANGLDCPLEYREVIRALTGRDPARFLFTIEFFPQEGKYHFDGHRACGVVCAPEETRRHGGRCPVCRRPLTVGVLHRVETLADRPPGTVRPSAIPSRHLVPLEELIAEHLGIGVGSVAVTREYERVVASGGSELAVLLDRSPEALAAIMSPRMAEGILRMRAGQVRTTPGYDGVYGKVQVFGEAGQPSAEAAPAQMGLFRT